MKTDIKYSHLLQVRVPKDLYDAVVKASEDQLTSPSAIIRLALIKAMAPPSPHSAWDIERRRRAISQIQGLEKQLGAAGAAST